MVSEHNNRTALLIPQGESRGVGLPAGYACVRSLGTHGVRTIIAAPAGGVPESASRYCSETVTVPPPQDDLLAYKDALVALATRPDISTIIPILEEDIHILSKYREEFEQHVSLVVPSLDTLSRACDRLQLTEAAAAAGVPAPEAWSLDAVPDWDRDLLIKSRYNLLTSEDVESLSPGESDIVKAQTHLQSGEQPDFETIREEMGHTPIVQEFVPRAKEYMFTALYDHGEPVATFQHEQIRGNSYTGAGGVYRESVYLPELETVARELLDELNWHGLACIEYMKDARTGDLNVAEINPRMWQSSLATARMGAEFPYWYWLQATGQKEHIESGYDVGVGCHYLKGELSYLVSLFRDESALVERPTLRTALWEMVTSSYRHPRCDYLRLDDPLPFLHDIVRNVHSQRASASDQTETDDRTVPGESDRPALTATDGGIDAE